MTEEELLIQAISNLNTRKQSLYPEYKRRKFEIKLNICKIGAIDQEMEDIEEDTQVLVPYCDSRNLMTQILNKTPQRGKQLSVNPYKSY